MSVKGGSLCIAVAVLVVVSCGSDGATSPGARADGSVMGSGSEPAATVSASAEPDSLLGLAPVPGDIEELPEAEIVDGGCGWIDDPWWVTRSDVVLSVVRFVPVRGQSSSRQLSTR